MIRQVVDGRRPSRLNPGSAQFYRVKLRGWKRKKRKRKKERRKQGSKEKKQLQTVPPPFPPTPTDRPRNETVCDVRSRAIGRRGPLRLTRRTRRCGSRQRRRHRQAPNNLPTPPQRVNTRNNVTEKPRDPTGEMSAKQMPASEQGQTVRSHPTPKEAARPAAAKIRLYAHLKVQSMSDLAPDQATTKHLGPCRPDEQFVFSDSLAR